ncbi:hypothetical protein BU26DRAFT_601720 [Trematosphaeria pertusa]|uniref:Cyanovirin-N domain-containing protein n=1 Tax=Trematosphaeria pertusa TaxID=390896 RepID=A0A6A6IT13_9PLEO|nr:uncharacterized protein BU26DRAFT_601720 [Trematosphaeria pertusa]KAF2253641.1 hypothetical protein BU26DRAFT_601720 [Trematosphaeria pertusa]
MKSIAGLVALIATSTGVQAQGPGNRPGLSYPSACGYWLVNNAGLTQSDIAKLRCDRTDTCNGEEWNSVYHMSITGQWWGGSQFCSSGCYVWTEGNAQKAGCH